MNNIPISICMLTYNNEPYLEQNLQRLKLLGCELVILDMGSWDQTVQIARQYADRFVTYQELRKDEGYHGLPDVPDEGKARNTLAAMAESSWILSVGPEETIPVFDGQRIWEMIQGKEPMLGRGAVLEIADSLTSKRIAFFKQNRLYHRDYHCYQGVIYPKLVRIRREEKRAERTRIIRLPMEIIHKSFLRTPEALHQLQTAYLQCIEDRKKVWQREEKKDRENPSSARAERARRRVKKELARLFLLEGICFQKMENWFMASRSFEQAIQYENALQIHDRCRLIRNMGIVYCNLQKEKTAMELMERYEALVQPGSSGQRFEQSYYLTQGHVYLNNGKITEAREYLEAAIAMGNYDKKGSDIMDAFQKLGSIYQILHMEKEMEHCIWEQIRLKKKYDALIQKYS